MCWPARSRAPVRASARPSVRFSSWSRARHVPSTDIATHRSRFAAMSPVPNTECAVSRITIGSSDSYISHFEYHTTGRKFHWIRPSMRPSYRTCGTPALTPAPLPDNLEPATRANHWCPAQPPECQRGHRHRYDKWDSRAPHAALHEVPYVQRLCPPHWRGRHETGEQEKRYGLTPGPEQVQRLEGQPRRPAQLPSERAAAGLGDGARPAPSVHAGFLEPSCADPKIGVLPSRIRTQCSRASCKVFSFSPFERASSAI